jgi:ArsR family transcriptional regulator
MNGENMRELIKASKALSDETRLRILHLLTQRECCVCEVMQALDISQARASRNLSALYDAGFLKLRHDGLWSLYSIDEETDRAYCKEMIDTIKKELDSNEVVQKDSERLKTAQRVGPSCAGKK